ncbi:MAG: GNAT family N-acetyltransferase [Acidobacteriota bacterium]|jgi:GNAT superfamily N-acetyltransferase
MNEIEVREMRPDEAHEVSDLAMRSFDAFVGHEFSEEGVAAYAEYAAADALRARQGHDHFTLVARVDGELAGMIELRHGEHLSMLFVDDAFHRRGIGGKLYDAALERLRHEDPDLEQITVNASRYGVPAYERLGFVVSGEEQTVNGITFTPMTARLATDAGDDET